MTDQELSRITKALKRRIPGNGFVLIVVPAKPEEQGRIGYAGLSERQVIQTVEELAKFYAQPAEAPKIILPNGRL